MTLVLSATTNDVIALVSDGLSLAEISENDGNPYYRVASHNETKIAPVWQRYGVGISGLAVLGQFSVLSWIRRFEIGWNMTQNEQIDTTERAAKEIGGFFTRTVENHRNAAPNTINEVSEGNSLLNIQVVGFDIESDGKEIPKVYEISIGKYNGNFPECRISSRSTKDKLNINMIGITDFVPSLTFAGGKEKLPTVRTHAAQDVVNLACFLVQSAISYTYFFSESVPIGGKIRAATITPLNGFEWATYAP